MGRCAEGCGCGLVNHPADCQVPVSQESRIAIESTEKAGVFISHIGQERPVALVLQKFIRQAFNSAFPVFVSSDQRSIPGGEGWWEFIRSEIKGRLVVLSLLSDESAAREWINYEAGVGDGSGARVVPVAIKG